MTPAERDKALRLERSAQTRRLVAMHRGQIGDVRRLLNDARDELEGVLKGVPTDFQAFQMPQIRASIDRALGEISEAMGDSARGHVAEAWRLGQDLVDLPIEAGGVRIAAVLPEIDTRQLVAIRTMMLDSLHDVTANIGGRIKGQLGLVLTGAQTPGQAIDAIAPMIEGGRGRAITITRTELGRVYSTATQERQEDAADVLPGLRKLWRRSGKVESRPTHDIADGQIVEVAKPFIVGGVELMFPRDPAGPASDTINCGCTSLSHMEHWDVARPGRQAFSDAEVRRNPRKRDLDAALS